MAAQKMRGFSLVELMISASILAGIFAAGNLLIQNQEQAQKKITAGIERNTAYQLIGKLLQQEGKCNALLRGKTFGANLAAGLQAALPLDVQKKITISAATILDHALAPVAANRIGPFILDVTAQFPAMGGGNDVNSYRFFLEAQFDGAKNIVACINTEVALLSATCDLLGGTLAIRDVDRDNLAQEVACRFAYCDPTILNPLYAANPAALTYPAPLSAPYRENDALSRYCLVQYLVTFLHAVADDISGSGRYVLQQGNDTMAGTLEGTGTANFQTNTALIANRWGINGTYRTNLQPPACPPGRYATGVNIDGTLNCNDSGLGSCTPICPVAAELCRGFIYDGVNGCGGTCYVIGTRAPACVNGTPDPTTCLNQTRTVQNGCGSTCVLSGTMPPSCPVSTDANRCQGDCYTATGICGANCTICGTKTDGFCAPTPTPTANGNTVPTPTPGGGTCYLVSKSFVGANPPKLTYPTSAPCRDNTSYINMRIRCPGETRSLAHYHAQRVQVGTGSSTSSSCTYDAATCATLYVGWGETDSSKWTSSPDTYDLKIPVNVGSIPCSTSSCSSCFDSVPYTHLDYYVGLLCFSNNGMQDCTLTDSSTVMTVQVKPGSAAATPTPNSFNCSLSQLLECTGNWGSYSTGPCPGNASSCVNLASSITLSEGQKYVVAGLSNDGNYVMTRVVVCESGKLENYEGNCVHTDAVHPIFNVNGCTSSSWSSNINCLRSSAGAAGIVDKTTASQRTYYGP